jgi:pimeloyl-ACP methyl ester carboxylesterase
MVMFHDFRAAALSSGGALWRGAKTRGGATRSELARRAALARQPGPDGISGPPLRLLLGELRAVLPKGPRHAPAAAHRPRPVMLLPGFGAHPLRMRRMLTALRLAGHSAHEWGLGFNLGPTPQNFAFLLSHLTGLAEAEGEPVVLIGWSLGGVFARELAKQRPDAVAGVITMGSPFSGDRRANNAWRAYQFVTGHPVDEPPIVGDFAAKPPVPTIALWSPRDGIVAPRSACGWPGERDPAGARRGHPHPVARDPAVIAEVLRQVDAI